MKHIGTFLKDLWDEFLRAGLSKDIYQSVQPLILQENTRIMQRLGGIGIAFGSVMSLLSLLQVVSPHVLPAYLTLLIVSLVSLMTRMAFENQGKVPGLIYSYLQMGAVLAYGVMNSAFFAPNPSTMGVTIIVLMTLVPFLLIDVPWRECLLILGTALAYLYGVRTCKDPAISGIETTNTISFCLVACLSAVVFTSRTIRSMADRLYIEKERDTDSLTGLSSRHAGEVLIRGQLLHGVQGVFIMMDIDDFKSANDQYGHPYGDHVLQAVGSAISASIRRKDIATRYGGDEFCILLVDCPMDDALLVVHRIQRFLSENMKDAPMQITCSFGLAQALPAEDMNDLIMRADQALYAAKRNGKNQIARAEDNES